MKSIEELLPLYCDGKLTQEETLLVQKWLEEDPEHENIMQTMLEMCLDIDALEVMAYIDTEKALQRVSGKIKRNRR